MNGASRIEIEVLVVSVALVVMPLLAAAVYLAWRYCLWRRRRHQKQQVSFLEVIRGGAIDR